MAGLSLSVARPVRLPLAGRIVAAVSALLLFAGVAGGVVAATGLDVPPVAVVAAGACACVAAVLGAVMAGRGKAEFAAYGIAAGLVLVVGLVLGGSFTAGGAQLINAALVRMGEHTQVYALPFKAGGAADLAVFCSVAGAALALACSLAAQRGWLVPCLAMAAVALVGAVGAWVSAGWWAAALAAGAVGCACVRTACLGNAHARASTIWACASVLLAALLAGGGVAAAFRASQADTSQADGVIQAALWRLEYGEAHFALPEGKLNNLGPLGASDQVAMTVDVDLPTYEYLRGFVGERYDAGTWQPLQSQDVMRNRSLLYWLDEDGFSANSQLADAARLSLYDQGDPASLQVKYGTVRRPYAYLPYAYAAGSAAQAITDQAQMRLDGASSQALEFDASLTRRAYKLQEAVDDAQVSADTAAGDAASDKREATPQAPALQSLRTYLDDNRAYGQFVQEAYRELPTDVEKLFRRLYGEPMELTSEQAKLQVQALLDDTVAYSADEETPNGDKDFVEYFLTETRAGYSVHYATAATLLMRYYGVPARYVEGYVLNTEALDAQVLEGEAGVEADGDAEDTDADSGEAAQSAGTYTLTERQAHAWVEYYLDGVGWIPFDVTPEWRDAGYYETTSNAELVDESQNWSVGEAQQDAVWTPPAEAEEDSEDDEQPLFLFAELDSLPISWPWVLAGFVLTLLVAFVVRDRVLHARLRRFLAQADDPERPASEVAPALFSYLVLLARECGGVPIQNQPFAQQALLLEEAQLCSTGQFVEAAQANDRALFAHEAASFDDVRVVGECIGAVRAGLAKNSGVLARFRQRHVKCLW